MQQESTLKNALLQCHDHIRKVVTEGAYVVDATAGNGNDTLFLAKLVGPAGKVLSFDIQEAAIETTRRKLLDEGLLERVELILSGHESLSEYVQQDLDAVMFNLGYRPGGDHRIGTIFPTTKQAIESAMDRLRVGGLISIVLYYGGDSGFEEKEALLAFIPTIDAKKYSVMKTEFVNRVNCPPILICIERND